jgi:hypothetical protein
LRKVISPCAADAPDLGAGGATVVAFRTGQQLETLLPALRQLLAEDAG